MKLVIATPLYPPEIGGPATYAEILAKELPKRGIEVEVVKFSDVRHLPPVVRHILYAWRVFARARSADLIFSLDAISVGWPAYFANLFLGKKFVVKMVGDHIWEQGRQRFGISGTLDELPNKSFGWHPYLSFLRILQQIVMRGANRVIVPSEYLKRIIMAWGTPAEKIEVIYNGVDLAFSTTPPSTRPSGFLVVSSGRKVPWKGFEALERVVAREKSWHLFIASGLPREEALGYAKAADVFALNSDYEGLSHALLEVMALGTPIIATNVGGNPELVEDGKTGFLIPPKDDEALYAALRRIQADPIAARERAVAAHAKAQQFSHDAMLTKTVELLKTI